MNRKERYFRALTLWLADQQCHLRPFTRKYQRRYRAYIALS